jgi:hypothetical protein
MSRGPIPGFNHLASGLERGFSGGHEVVFGIGRRAGSGFFGGSRSDPGGKRQYSRGAMASCPVAGRR